MKKKAMTFLLTLLVVYSAALAALYLTQRAMIYYPDKRRFTPAQMGYDHIDVVTATTADGIRLEGWYRAPQPGHPVIVLFHGNADHHAFAAQYMKPHMRDGDGVLVTEYRGYAGNPGRPDEQGLYADARAWIGWLQKTGIADSDMILYGQSLGTGIAVQMALEYPRARALVLYAPYTSLPDVARTRYWFFPVRTLMKDQYRSIDKIGNVAMPVLIVNGLADRVVPPSHGVALYNAVRQNKSLVQIEGGGHADIPAEIVAAKVTQFLSKVKKSPE